MLRDKLNEMFPVLLGLYATYKQGRFYNSCLLQSPIFLFFYLGDKDV